MLIVSDNAMIFLLLATPRASRPLHLPLNELGSPFYGDTKLSPKSTTPPCQTPTIPVKRQLQTVKKPDLKAKRIRMTPASTGIPEPSSSETGNVSISVVRELLHDTLSQFLPPNTSPSHEMAHAYMSASSRGDLSLPIMNSSLLNLSQPSKCPSLQPTGSPAPPAPNLPFSQSNQHPHPPRTATTPPKHTQQSTISELSNTNNRKSPINKSLAS